MKKTIAALALSIFAVSGFAAPSASDESSGVTGNFALRSMEHPEGERDTYISGILYGFMQGMIVSQVATGAKLFCPPEDMSFGQLYDIMKRELRLHPESRHLRFSALTFGYMVRNYPCSSKSGK